LVVICGRPHGHLIWVSFAPQCGAILPGTSASAHAAEAGTNRDRIGGIGTAARGALAG
tara:strand:- start:71 stop:244 length:174 start_codon:yes stop_codon:yes gene_type:complete